MSPTPPAAPTTAANIIPPTLLRIVAASVPIVIACYFLSRLHDHPAAPETMSAAAIAERLRPVAQPLGADSAAAPAATALLKGRAVYEATCVACHGGGIAGAPKFGDRKAWAPRLAQGYAVLVKHAIEGYTGKAGMMPPKGGGSYEDVEVARAVAYMGKQAGGAFSEPDSLPAH